MFATTINLIHSVTLTRMCFQKPRPIFPRKSKYMNKSRGNIQKKNTWQSVCLSETVATCKDGIYGQFSTAHIKMDVVLWLQSGNCLNSEFFPYLLFTLVRKIKTKNPQNEWELKVLAWWQTAGQWTQQEGRWHYIWAA